MDHFNITQACIYCLRGSRLFRVDLDCYDAEGRLIITGTEKMNRFRFSCQFCYRESSLDFYRFSHPDLICYLKRLHEHFEEIKKKLDILYILCNNVKAY